MSEVPDCGVDGDTPFDAYAAYYDLLYRDKDYAGEAAYVNALIRRYAPRARDVLELGCGTGGHALQLATHGYRVVGIDRSESMVQRARKRAAEASVRLVPDFLVSDLRGYRAGRKFDVVLALFHVMSYQNTNADLLAAMKTVAAHLDRGGVFIFDCWHGPGVLSDPPVTRVRRLQGEGFAVTRIAEPVQFPNANRVDVHYEVLVEGPQGLERIREVHSMRYLFTPEIDWLFEAAGLHRMALETWMEGKEPVLNTWNACYVAVR